MQLFYARKTKKKKGLLFLPLLHRLRIFDGTSWKELHFYPTTDARFPFCSLENPLLWQVEPIIKTKREEGEFCLRSFFLLSFHFSPLLLCSVHAEKIVSNWLKNVECCRLSPLFSPLSSAGDVGGLM